MSYQRVPINSMWKVLMKPIFHAVALLGEYQLKQQGASAN